MAAAHATVAAFSLFLFSSPTRAEAPGLDAAKQPVAQPDRDGPASGPTPRSGRAAPDQELFVFGLMNLGVATQDGALARAYALAAEPARMAPALAIATGGRIAAIALLLHFVLQYARVRRPKWAFAALYGSLAVLEIASALGLVARFGEAHLEDAWIAGIAAPAVLAPAGPLGGVFAALGLAAAAAGLAMLGQAFLRGRREAVAFVGMTLLMVTALYDALRDIGWVVGPPLAPLGYAALVNGVMMTLLSRFTALRSQLEARARELKDRARYLARSREELRAAQDELVRKEQLAAVGELSAVVAHEVRNPLAIISNAVATLRRPGIEAEDRDTLLGILEEESSRLNRLVGELLRYARPINIERQMVSLREIVERSLGLAEGRVDVGVELIESAEVERVWADPNLIRQVFDNLVTNAVQAMSSGGVLTVTLIAQEVDGVRGVEVQIQDTGEGMDTEVRSRALDPFFTTRPSGTGLGLAIVARIVDAHGGVLSIKSKAGAGTVMHVFLPTSAEGRLSDHPERRSSEPPLPTELRKALRRGNG
ncbi:Sensor protein of zinc sigma-54-dependent two-component system [Minicystis rosea]|nr:Sensor protein of zinc sigma-54-dependent two-component system [Minicystis rosea]